MSKIVRFQALLAGLWAGTLVAVGGIAAPALFSVLERQHAGTGAGQIFHIEARLSLAFAILLFVVDDLEVLPSMIEADFKAIKALTSVNRFMRWRNLLIKYIIHKMPSVGI